MANQNNKEEKVFISGDVEGGQSIPLEKERDISLQCKKCGKVIVDSFVLVCPSCGEVLPEGGGFTRG